MADFIRQNLTGSRFEDVYLTGAQFHDVDLTQRAVSAWST